MEPQLTANQTSADDYDLLAQLFGMIVGIQCLENILTVDAGNRNLNRTGTDCSKDRIRPDLCEKLRCQYSIQAHIDFAVFHTRNEVILELANIGFVYIHIRKTDQTAQRRVFSIKVTVCPRSWA